MKNSANPKFRKVEAWRKLISQSAEAGAEGGIPAKTKMTNVTPSNEMSSRRSGLLPVDPRKKMSIASLMNTVQLDDDVQDHGPGSTSRTPYPPHQSLSQAQSIRLPPIKSLGLPVPLRRTLGTELSAAMEDGHFDEDLQSQGDAGSNGTISIPSTQSSAALTHADEREQLGEIPTPERVPPRAEANEPSYTLPELAALAILASPERRETLAGICQWISDNFPYFRHLGLAEGWQNIMAKRLRSQIERSKIFAKQKIRQNKVFWSVNPAYDCSRLENKLRLIEERTEAGVDSRPSSPPGGSNTIGEHSCFACSSLFDNRLELDDHVATAHTRLFRCSDCDSEFRLVKDLRAHARTSGHSFKEGYTNWGVSRCEECGRAYIGKRHLQRHAYSSNHTVAGLPPHTDETEMVHR